MGLGLISMIAELITPVVVYTIKWFEGNTSSVKHTVGDTTLIDGIVKWFEGNTSRVKHIVGDNHDGTVTVITQVIYKGEIIYEWNETAKTKFLSEMKRDHKREGKEYLRKYKTT